jgi:hypothetical protein
MLTQYQSASQDKHNTGYAHPYFKQGDGCHDQQYGQHDNGNQVRKYVRQHKYRFFLQIN